MAMNLAEYEIQLASTPSFINHVSYRTVVKTESFLVQCSDVISKKVWRAGVQHLDLFSTDCKILINK